eukprot:Tbor_TRINITY_DN3389_c0_g1::TRINITY_DN3389_c0_g1_i1::g.23425::m.23425/K12580/CNOT3, NOT3; CCR4-NOT transcription complex subunit 3
MANNRKVQGEIDKLLKKVQEGFVSYDEVYEKFNVSQTQPLKERFEGELKKEIKKLQRLREQIKSLITSNEVKDKKTLEDTRREIEERMEDFKVCERETKTKAYSKEGLASMKNDPNDCPLAKTEAWVKQCISEIGEQIETTEFDLKTSELGSGGRKKRKSNSTDSDPRMKRLDRLKVYNFRLEQILRLLINEELTPDEVDVIRDEVERFVSENGEENFEEKVDLFEEFCLPEVGDIVEEDQERIQTDVGGIEKSLIDKNKLYNSGSSMPLAPSAVMASPKSAEEKRESGTMGGRVVLTEGAKKGYTANDSLSAPAVSSGKTFNSPAGFIPSAATKNVTQSGSYNNNSNMPKLTAAEVARGAARNSQGNTPGSSAVTSKNNFGSPGALNNGAWGSNTMLGSAGAFQDVDPSQLDDDADAANDDTFGDDCFRAPVGNLSDLAAMTTQQVPAGDWMKGRPPGLPVSGKLSQPVSKPTAPAPAVASPVSPLIPGGLPEQQQPAATSAPLVVSTALLKQMLQKKAESLSETQKLLDISYEYRTHGADTDKPEKHIKSLGSGVLVSDLIVPNAQAIQQHCKFPGTHLRILNDISLFDNLSTDVLFFIFYYQQQTFWQYQAARVLKKQGYRYHKKYHTWFQRHSKPKVTEDEYEQGAYVYFDFEAGWCQRIKQDFQFKYQYLEDEMD